MGGIGGGGVLGFFEFHVLMLGLISVLVKCDSPQLNRARIN
jgi:hypothetical protein